MGFGDAQDLDESLLRQIAEAACGQYAYASTPYDLLRVYVEIRHLSSGGTIIDRFSGQIRQDETTPVRSVQVPADQSEMLATVVYGGSRLDLILTDPHGRRVDSGYPGATLATYAQLIERIRSRMPEVSIATDVIVGFPGETEAQFQRTLDWLAQLKLDVCHVAMYSPRPGTVSSKLLPDDVPAEEKKRRLDAVNQLQEQIVAEINQELLDRSIEILVEGKQRGRWKGRTRTNKLVFFDDDSGTNWQGKLVNVEVTWTGPWSMRGRLPSHKPIATSSEPLVLSLTA